LFQAWLRKDAALWSRLFKLLHDNAAAPHAAAPDDTTTP
jgi:hypothetical protein